MPDLHFRDFAKSITLPIKDNAPVVVKGLAHALNAFNVVVCLPITLLQGGYSALLREVMDKYLKNQEQEAKK